MTDSHDVAENEAPVAYADLLPLELVIVDHYERESRHVVRKLPVILGRDEKADVPLVDPWVSHAHCEIYQLGQALIVRDLDSKNGVFLHGARVNETHVLPGDRITLGRTEITLHFGPKTAATQEIAVTATMAKPVSPNAVPQTFAPPKPRPPRGPETEELLY